MSGDQAQWIIRARSTRGATDANKRLLRLRPDGEWIDFDWVCLHAGDVIRVFTEPGQLEGRCEWLVQSDLIQLEGTIGVQATPIMVLSGVKAYEAKTCGACKCFEQQTFGKKHANMGQCRNGNPHYVADSSEEDIQVVDVWPWVTVDAWCNQWEAGPR